MIEPSSHNRVILTCNGLTAQIMALCLYHAGCNILWLAGKPTTNPETALPDNRTTTIHQAGMNMLAALGVSALLEQPAWPLHRILVSDRAQKVGSDSRSEWPLDWKDDAPMAHVVLNADLKRACQSLIDTYNIPSRQVNITSVSTHNKRIVTDSDGCEHGFDLLVICAGGQTDLISQTGFKKINQNAVQTALVGMISSTQPTAHTAYQRFLAEGPIALMAMDEAHYSLVWTVSDNTADRLMALPIDGLNAALNNQFGTQAGQLSFCEPPLRWPLTPHYIRKIAKNGVVLAGDSAHGLHPLAGMGLNLGLADAGCLLDCLIQARDSGLAPSHISICEHYQSKRQAEILALTATTQILNRWFSRPNGLIRLIGGVGMSVIGRSALMSQLKQLAIGGQLSNPALFSGRLPH